MARTDELRVFISSTFRDLQEEREHLVKKIFPEIRAICRQRGVTFTEVDLRWGLTSEEVERGGVISICLEEIDRCCPYFIGILGERYGWVPPREHVLDPGLLEAYPWLGRDGAADQSITAMEIQHGALLHSHEEIDAFFYFRHPDVTPEEFVETDPRYVRRLENLKSSIRESEFPVREGFRTPEELGERIREDLHRIIEQRFPRGEAPTQEEQERKAHEAFALARRRSYVPNVATVTRLQELADAGRQGIVVTAPSGAGKSALLAYWTSLYRAEHPDHVIVEHYVGATASGLDHHGLMLRVMSEIRNHYHIERPLPNTPASIERSFAAWLAYARDRPLLVVLDAVNQLPEQSRRLGWLPTHLPETVQFVISTTEGPALQTLCDREYAVLEVKPLGVQQRRILIESYLAEFRKKLTPEQLDRILADERSDNPLFLRTVIEELRVFGLHEELDRRIDDMLASTDLDDLFQRILARMESDYDRDLVQQTMMYLWASRAGLTESELLDLLNVAPRLEEMADGGFNRLDLSAFLLALDYHLLRNAGQLHFFHDFLRRAVESRYVLPSENEVPGKGASRRYEREVLHLRIADYLHARSFDAREVARRDAQELTYQLYASRDLHRLATTLSSLPHTLAMSEGDAEIDMLSYWARLREQGFSPEKLYTESIREYESGGVGDAELCTALQLTASLFERLGLWEAATAAHRHQLQIATDNDLSEEEGRALTGLGGLFRLRGEHESALEHLERARGLFTELGNDLDATRALCTIGLVHSGRADFDRALECLEQGSETYLRLNYRHGYAKSVGDMGSVRAMRGEFDRALECFRLQEEICEEFGDLTGMSNAIGNRGNVYLGLGDYDRALECYQRSLEVDEQLGDLRGAASLIGNMGVLYHERHEHEQARECFERRLNMCTELGDRSGAAAASGSLGLLYMDRGMYDEAREYLSDHRARCEEIGDRLGVATATGNLGKLFFLLGEFALSREHLLENISISRELGENVGLARAIGNLGVLYQEMGEFRSSLECYRDAVEIYRSIDANHQLIDLHAREAQVMLDLLDHEESAPVWIEEFVTGAAGEEWRATLLAFARSTMSEYRELCREYAPPGHEFEEAIIEARISAAEGDHGRARTLLNLRLDDDPDNSQRAGLHYWLWKLDPDSEIENRSRAEDHYRRLVSDVPNHRNRSRLEELQSTGESA